MDLVRKAPSAPPPRPLRRRPPCAAAPVAPSHGFCGPHLQRHRRRHRRRRCRRSMRPRRPATPLVARLLKRAGVGRRTESAEDGRRRRPLVALALRAHLVSVCVCVGSTASGVANPCRRPRRVLRRGRGGGGRHGPLLAERPRQFMRCCVGVASGRRFPSSLSFSWPRAPSTRVRGAGEQAHACDNVITDCGDPMGCNHVGWAIHCVAAISWVAAIPRVATTPTCVVTTPPWNFRAPPGYKLRVFKFTGLHVKSGGGRSMLFCVWGADMRPCRELGVIEAVLATDTSDCLSVAVLAHGRRACSLSHQQWGDGQLRVARHAVQPPAPPGVPRQGRPRRAAEVEAPLVEHRGDLGGVARHLEGRSPPKGAALAAGGAG